MKVIIEMINQKEKELIFFNNGDRRMGDFLNGNEIGKHVRLTKNGEVTIENF